jgi:hypothetical protein
MTNFVLRELDDKSWQKFKVKCATEGVTAKSVIADLIDHWSDGRIKLHVGVPAAYRGRDTKKGRKAR